MPHGLKPALDSPHGLNALVMRKSFLVGLVYWPLQQSVHKARAIDISGRPNIPVVVFPDVTHLVEPTDVALHEKVQQLGLIH